MRSLINEMSIDIGAGLNHACPQLLTKESAKLGLSLRATLIHKGDIV
jgi:hypothetical protein